MCKAAKVTVAEVGLIVSKMYHKRQNILCSLFYFMSIVIATITNMDYIHFECM